MYHNGNHLTLSEQSNENFQSTEKIILHAYFRSSHGRCSVRKGILRNFTKFTGKHLCQRPAKFLGILFLQNTSGRLLSVTFFDTGLFVSFRYLKTMVCLENKDPVTREEFDSSRVTGSLFSRHNGLINGSVNTELCVPLNYVYCVPFFVLILL